MRVITLTFCSIAFRDEAIEAIIPRLAQIGYDAVEIWANHVVETHPLTLADVPGSALQLLDKVGAENLKILYQPTAPETLIPYYERYLPHIRHLHLQNQDSEGKHMWLEDGVLDLTSFAQRLKQDGYNDSVSVEYCWKGVTWDRAESAYGFLAPHLCRQ